MRVCQILSYHFAGFFFVNFDSCILNPIFHSLFALSKSKHRLLRIHRTKPLSTLIRKFILCDFLCGREREGRGGGWAGESCGKSRVYVIAITFSLSQSFVSPRSLFSACARTHNVYSSWSLPQLARDVLDVKYLSRRMIVSCKCGPQKKKKT